MAIPIAKLAIEVVGSLVVDALLANLGAEQRKEEQKKIKEQIKEIERLESQIIGEQKKIEKLFKMIEATIQEIAERKAIAQMMEKEKRLVRQTTEAANKQARLFKRMADVIDERVNAVLYLVYKGKKASRLNG